MSLLVAIDVATKSYVLEGKVRLELQVALDELAEFFAIFVAHMNKFHAVAVGADIADYRREMDLAKAGTNLELDGIANAEFSRRLQVRAAQADRLHAGERFDGLDAHELVAQDLMFAGSDFHELGHGRSFLRQTDLVDHHRHDHRVRIGEDCGEYEGGALSRRRIGRPGKLAHRQILKVPFPTRHRASEATQQALWISNGQQLNGCGHALAARSVEPGFEKVEYGHTDGSQEARHSWHHLRAVWFSKQQSQPVEKPFGVALQQTWQHGIQRPVGQRGIHE